MSTPQALVEEAVQDTFEIIRRVASGPGLHTVLRKRGPGGIDDAMKALAVYNTEGKPLSKWTSMSGLETTLGFGSLVVARVFHEEAWARHLTVLEARCAEARRQAELERLHPYNPLEVPRKDPKDIWL